MLQCLQEASKGQSIRSSCRFGGFSHPPPPFPIFFYFIFNNFCWFRKLVLVSLRMLYNQPKHIHAPTWNLRIEVVQKRDLSKKKKLYKKGKGCWAVIPIYWLLPKF